VTVNARSETTPDAPKDTAELQQAVESLVRDRPDLIDPRNLRRFKQALNEHIAARNSERSGESSDKTAKIEREKARKLTSFATVVSGAVSAGLIATAIAPGAPELVIVGVALLGLLGSKVVARGLDRLMERKEQDSSSPRSSL
jgi:hypothetical protein